MRIDLSLGAGSVLNRTPSPKVLLFDLGGVLVDNNHLRDLPNIVPVAPGQDLHDLWLSSPSVRAFERGRISVEQFAAGFVREWNSPLSPEDFLARFAEWPKGFYPGAEERLRKLRSNFRIAYLSNANAVHWARFDDILAHADVAVASHLCGMVKPDPEIFTYVIGMLDVEPHEISFFDDSIRNVAAARVAGIDAHLVKGFAELDEKLRSLAIS